MGAGVLLWAPNDTVLLKFKARDKQYNDAGSRVTAACKKKAEKLGKDEALLVRGNGWVEGESEGATPML